MNTKGPVEKPAELESGSVSKLYLQDLTAVKSETLEQLLANGTIEIIVSHQDFTRSKKSQSILCAFFKHLAEALKNQEPLMENRPIILNVLSKHVTDGLNKDTSVF